MSISAHNSPTEVLLQIFHYAVGNEPLQLGGTAVAFPISQVCRDWRQIALDSPTLWEDVRFPYGAYKNKNPLLDEVLARSGTRPLTAVFSHPNPSQAGQIIDFWRFKLYKRMKNYCDRIKAIYVILPKHALLEFNDILGNQLFPMLTHLHVVQSDNLSPTSLYFFNAPVLAVFHVESVNISYNSEFRNTSTSLRSMRFVDMRSVDISTPVMHGLHDLTIVRSPLIFPNDVGAPPKLALTSLTLDGITSSGRDGELQDFLVSFHLPELRHIELANLDHILPFPSHFVRALSLPAVYPALRSAKLTALPLDDITPDFCRALPALESLELVDVDPQPLLRLLRADRTLCPGLREFYMDGHLRRR
ncbi:hypothetical protein B0H19DRAFT_1321328 [Mycena capillaripes]|nr:hypothetical protein B0H19DRAFT_1321328 [Mycena capillaripes]